MKSERILDNMLKRMNFIWYKLIKYTDKIHLPPKFININKN